MNHVTRDYGAAVISVGFVQVKDHDIPKTIHDFLSFPERKGWKLGQDWKLEPGGSTSPERFDVLLQAWLFFGLIFTVVQTNGKPILKFEDLCPGGEYLNTEELQNALKNWADWEKNHPEDLWFRMIQIEYVLDRARRVVRTNCGYRVDADGNDTTPYSEVKSEGARELTDETALSIMTVGELLSAVKLKITQAANASLRGWHGDDHHGWGPPRYVFKKMKREKWCKRAIHLLRGQFRSNATMLLGAYFVYLSTKRMTEGHDDCSATECKVSSTDEQGKYVHLHRPGCDQMECNHQNAKGPNMAEVHAILDPPLRNGQSPRAPSIPLLRFRDDDEDSVELEVAAHNDNKPFAAISHVWADGWGNENANKLPICHLQFIRRQLRRASDVNSANGRPPVNHFWMDTLLVPVESDTAEQKKLKKRAIGQIFNVFQDAAFTIVLDNGLCEMAKGEHGRPIQAAMKILASGWMRRLWTLQEAFLSKQLFITFREEGQTFNNLQNFDQLDDNLKKPQDVLASPLVEMVRDQLLQNIMGHERENRNFYLYRKGDTRIMPKQTAAILVANAWRAARWRTTSNPAHETLALATLLDLKYEGTRIEEAGLSKSANDYEMDELVQAFWKTFHDQYEGGIPAGIIFLPGAKVSIPGFGWAPRTMMTAHEVDYPDPLSQWVSPTSLELGGLLVKYPGFLLHTTNDRVRQRILGTDNTNETFQFPSDRKLLEWYKARPADCQESIPFLNEINSKWQLAIILSRPQPGESPPEIGLLVGIHSVTEKKTRQGEEMKVQLVFNCYIIRRVHVWRDVNSNSRSPVERTDHASSTHSEPHWSVIETEPGEDTCISEVVGADQGWVVDGYISDRLKAAEPTVTVPQTEDPNQIPSPWLSVFGGRRRWKNLQNSTARSPNPTPGNITPRNTFPSLFNPSSPPGGDTSITRRSTMDHPN